MKTRNLFATVACLLAVGCATDTAVAPTPEIEIERITTWPAAKPVESFRERLARIRIRMEESIRRGETLPGDVLARWEKMEKMDHRLRQMEMMGYTEKVVGPGASIMTLAPLPDSGLEDEVAASSRCGNPNLR